MKPPKNGRYCPPLNLRTQVDLVELLVQFAHKKGMNVYELFGMMDVIKIELQSTMMEMMRQGEEMNDGRS